MKHQTLFKNAPITLTDWRSADGSQPVKSVAGTLSVEPHRINLVLEDGRSLWIEVEADRLRVHNYASEGHDEPLNVDVLKTGFVLDTSELPEGAVVQ